MKSLKFDHIKYWENRYRQLTNENNHLMKYNSGRGSYGEDAKKKAEYINDIIKKYNIKTLNDFGHGDGNQLSLINGFEKYYGYDVSETIRKRCISMYPDQEKYIFLNDAYDFFQYPKSDLSMSLDVLYHILDQEPYEEYLRILFSISKYVLIYAVDKDEPKGIHCMARKFTTYISETFTNFELIDTKNVLHEHVGMYLYKEKS